MVTSPELARKGVQFYSIKSYSKIPQKGKEDAKLEIGIKKKIVKYPCGEGLLQHRRIPVTVGT